MERLLLLFLAVVSCDAAQADLIGAGSKEAGISRSEFLAIALLESGIEQRQGKVAPYPLAINIAGKAFYPGSRTEAERLIKNALAHGNENIDIGLMQINYKTHKKLVGSATDLLDVETNVLVASRIIRTAMQSTPSRRIGLGRYHSWKIENSRIYGAKVMAMAKVIENP
jgi:hypothetical protein